MKFESASWSLAYSECGRFERRTSIGVNGKEYFNCWDMRTGKHVAAGFSATDIGKQCEQYLERQNG